MYKIKERFNYHLIGSVIFMAVVATASAISYIFGVDNFWVRYAFTMIRLLENASLFYSCIGIVLRSE